MLTLSSLKKGLIESRWTRLALITISLQFILVIIYESITYVDHHAEINDIEYYAQYAITNASSYLSANETQLMYSAAKQAQKNAESLSVYHVLFMVAQLFTVIVQLDAIMAKNTMQLIAVAFFEFCMFIYSLVQWHQAKVLLDNANVQFIRNQFPPGTYHTSQWSEIFVIVIMFLASVCQGALTWRLFQDFGWSIYKKIGADLLMRNMFRWYQVFLMLLKFDVFFFLGFSIQILVIIKTDAQPDMITHLAEHISLSLLVTLVMLGLAFWGVISERTGVMICFMVCGVGSLVYFIINIVNVNTYPNEYLGSQIFLTFFLSVCIVLIVVTLVVSYFCLCNFGKGLKFHVKHENQQLPDNVLMDGVNSAGQYVHRETKDRRWSIE